MHNKMNVCHINCIYRLFGDAKNIFQGNTVDFFLGFLSFSTFKKMLIQLFFFVSAVILCGKRLNKVFPSNWEKNVLSPLCMPHAFNRIGTFHR